MAFTLGKTTGKHLIPINGKLVKRDTLETELNKLKFESTNFDKEYGKFNPRSVAKLGEVEDKIKEIEAIDKLLDSHTAFVNESVQRLDYIPSPRGFSFGSACEKIYLDANNGKIPTGVYENNTIAPTSAEGELVKSENMNPMLDIIKADNENAVIFHDSLMTGVGLYNDDSDTVDSAFTDNHEIRLENAESVKACEVFMSAKDPIELDPMFLNGAINLLSGKTRRSDSMMILTNKSGFSKLDQVDSVSGVSLIKKINGEMIYRDKYVIQELPDEILKSDDNGAPCIIGALTDICKIFIIRDEGLHMEDWGDWTVHNRRIRKEIVALTTTSDNGFVWGYLA